METRGRTDTTDRITLEDGNSGAYCMRGDIWRIARDSDERCFDSGVCRHSVLSYAIQVAGLAFTGVICRWPSRLTVECLREVPNTAEYVIPAVHYLIMSLPLVYMLYNPPVRQFVLWLISQSDSP